MQSPSKKVVVAFVITLVTQVAAFLAKDTEWTGWLPPKVQPLIPVVLALLSLAASYQVAETNPPASAFNNNRND